MFYPCQTECMIGHYVRSTKGLSMLGTAQFIKFNMNIHIRYFMIISLKNFTFIFTGHASLIKK